MPIFRRQMSVSKSKLGKCQISQRRHTGTLTIEKKINRGRRASEGSPACPGLTGTVLVCRCATCTRPARLVSSVGDRRRRLSVLRDLRGLFQAYYYVVMRLRVRFEDQILMVVPYVGTYVYNKFPWYGRFSESGFFGSGPRCGTVP